MKTEENRDALKKLAPYTRDYPVPEAGNLFYLCSGKSCMPPVPELSKLYEKLKES